MEKIKVLVVPSDRTGVSYFRSTNPHIALEKFYSDEFHVEIDYEPKLNDDNWLKQFDIIHYHRTLGNYNNVEILNKKLLDLGIVSVMDLDDYWDLPTTHPGYGLHKHSGIKYKIISNLKNAQYITTTTSLFANEISKYNKNVFILPNAIDPNEKQYIPNLEKSDKIRIGWLGGSSHLADLKLLDGLVSKLNSAKLLDKIQFVLCGFDINGTHTNINKDTGEQNTRQIRPEETVWNKYEQIFTNNYNTISSQYKEFLLKYSKEEYSDIINEPYRRVWTKPISGYASNYNLFDISLAPLQENIFNKVKSQLKVIEAGFHHKVIIAQDFGPYQIDIKNAVKFGGGFDESANGILIDSNKNHKDWFESIKKLVNNPHIIPILQENLYNTVKDSYSIEQVSRNRRELYKELLNKRIIK